MSKERRRLAGRVVVEATAVVAGVAALGLLIEGPLGGLAAEDVVNVKLAEAGTPRWDRITWVLSTYSDTVPTIAAGLGLGVWQWSRGAGIAQSARPLAATALETVVFMSAAALVKRPRPAVRRLDRAAPTSSFPSGHTGASTALHLLLADVLLESGAWRPAAAGVRLLVPPAVGMSRLYRGMHHPSDVVVGIAVGMWAARLVRRVTSRVSGGVDSPRDRG